jgi:hypothetical protein
MKNHHRKPKPKRRPKPAIESVVLPSPSEVTNPYLSEKLSDLIVIIIINLAITSMGVLMIMHPTPPLPVDTDLYRPVAGVISRFKDNNQRGDVRGLVFAVASEKGEFISRDWPTRQSAKNWEVGRTSVAFFILPGTAAATSDRVLIDAYGLRVGEGQIRSLEEEIQSYNARPFHWVAAMPIVIGILGLLLSAGTWRRRNRIQLGETTPPS